MCGARLVIGEVRLERVGSDLLWNEVVQHQDVRLLEDLRTDESLVTQKQIGGNRAA